MAQSDHFEKHLQCSWCSARVAVVAKKAGQELLHNPWKGKNRQQMHY